MEVSKDQTKGLPKLFTDCLRMADPKELAEFINQYAAIHPEFVEALVKRFTPPMNIDSKESVYAKQIERCFIVTPCSDETDLERLSEKLNVFWEKARWLLDLKSYGDVVSIALQVIRSVGEHFDEQVYYDEIHPLSYDCNEATTLLDKVIRLPEVSFSFKKEILDELQELVGYPAYTEYCLCDIENWVEQFKALLLTPEELLELVNADLEKENGQSVSLSLVQKKLDLLYRMKRFDEINDVIDYYIHIPEIRYMKVGRLLKDSKETEAIREIENGLFEADSKRWKEQWSIKLLEIYIKQDNKKEMLRLNRELFLLTHAFTYYTALKELLPPAKWKDCVENLLAALGDTNTDTKAYIYIHEKRYKDLLDYVMERYSSFDTGGRWFQFRLDKFGPYLKEAYPKEVLQLYVDYLRDMALYKVGRTHYQQIVSVLNQMLTYPGGEQVVCALVKEFRTTYKQRRAMMDVLRGF